MSVELREVLEYLSTNLRIQVDQETEYGPKELISVKLLIGDTVISEDYCELPDGD